MPRNSRLERAIFSTNFQLNVSGSGYFSQFNIVIFFNVVLIILIANPEHLFPQSLYYMNDATAWAGRQRRYKLAGVRANRSLMVQYRLNWRRGRRSQSFVRRHRINRYLKI